MVSTEEVLNRIQEGATQRGIAPAELSMAEIADITGRSRSSLYRRFGNRAGIDKAMETAGLQPGTRVSAEERLIVAARDLIEKRGVQALTLESVAEAANVALPTVYASFQNRARLMRTVFTRFSPVPRVTAALPQELPVDAEGFQMVIETIYLEIWDYLHTEKQLLGAVLTEVTRDPASEVSAWLHEEYLPMVAENVLPLLETSMARGVMRPAPVLLAAQSLIGPMLMHVVTRPFVESTGIPLMPREETCAHFAELFCRSNLIGE